MLKVELHEDFTGLNILENDRGEWEYVHSDTAFTLIGFGGENIITIIVSPMQSGKTDVVVVHNAIDSYIRVAHKTSTYPAHARLNGLINDLIEEVADYPTTLELQ